MVSFPNSKINIGLYVTGKRPDGYHDLETVFYPVAIKDAIEIILAPQQKKELLFTSSGDLIPGNEENNLCVQAYRLLKADYPNLPAIQMHLHKAIPMGAGLGGGSADAAFALQLMNEKFALQLTHQKLLEYAAALGSDCPFFILNKSCYATGRGELLEELKLDLPGYNLLVVHPRIHVNTADAFKMMTPGRPGNDLVKKIAQPVSAWKGQIINDFEKPVFLQFPEIGAIKGALYEHGALYSSLSGSGSAVYGIFEAQFKPVLNFPPHYFCRWV